MPKFERKMEIDAPVEKVWETLTKPESWPQWFPGMDTVTNVQTTDQGVTFDWSDDERTGKGSIVLSQPLKQLKVMTQVGDDKDSHVFKLKPSGGFFGLNADECQIKYELDTLMGGGILSSFVAGGNPRDAMRVKKAMHQLRKLVESL